MGFLVCNERMYAGCLACNKRMYVGNSVAGRVHALKICFLNRVPQQ
jgi:hypothetical protein